MNEEVVVSLLRETLILILKVSAPMLIVSLVIGLIVSILQTVTSIQEQTLTFVPKLIGIFVVLMMFGNWIMKSISDFTTYLFANFGLYIS